MQRVIENNKDKLIELCQEYDVQTLYVYGSALTDHFKETSNIDILISFKKNISIEKY